MNDHRYNIQMFLKNENIMSFDVYVLKNTNEQLSNSMTYLNEYAIYPNVDIYIPKERFDNASLDKICSDMNVRKGNILTEEVRMISIDSWYENSDKAVDPKLCNFFKIDVQGFEYEVLLGVK